MLTDTQLVATAARLAAMIGRPLGPLVSGATRASKLETVKCDNGCCTARVPERWHARRLICTSSNRSPVRLASQQRERESVDGSPGNMHEGRPLRTST